LPAKKNLIGNKYGLLTVKSETNQRKYNSVLWECECECGNICYVTSIDLEHDRVNSCGCLTHKSRYENLTGQRFGRLVVVEECGISNKRNQVWKCRCDCGNEIKTEAYRLKNGTTKSCGCLQKDKAKEMCEERASDLTGKQYGLLTVIKKMSNNMWLCRCSCEEQNEIEVNGRYLLNGHVSSCGCLKKSLGEYKINKLLECNNIPFIRNAHFDDCKFIDTNYHAYYDFYIDNKYIVEYDGEQHFKPTCFNGIKSLDAMKNFNKTKEHDEFKNNYCFANNIPIIRIPYTHLNELSLEDLLLETSKFILKKEAS
jgi:hypothetical protein